MRRTSTRRSTRRSTRISSGANARRTWVLGLCLTLVGAPGCWEQVSAEWFPQMKWQPAVQAFERNPYQDRVVLFVPPEGTVPVDWADVADPGSLSMADQETIENPRPATLASLKNGEELFRVNCATCHGPTGAGNGPIAAPNGPIQGVLPIGPGAGFSLAPALTDGHIYTTISIGRGRMPSYRRISPDDRWDIVNYIRELNGQGGRS